MFALFMLIAVIYISGSLKHYDHKHILQFHLNEWAVNEYQVPL